MTQYSKNEDDVIDLGAATEETRGSDIVGREDTQTQAKFLVGGIQQDD